MKFKSFKLLGLALFILGLGLVGSLGPGRAQSCDVTVYPGESIQSAIDSVSAGAVICLAEGSWPEDLSITKDDLLLRGEGPSKTIVTGSLLIQVAGQFTVEGLTIQGSAVGKPPAVYWTGMVLIPAGTFQMGDSFNEGSPDEWPVHEVYVSAFYMDKFEVTKGLWDEVASWAQANGYDIKPNDGFGEGPNYPVYSVSWYDAVKWANARSEKEGLTPCYYTDSSQTTVYRTGERVDVPIEGVKWDANGYRLPTEAEWEKAARGGLSGARYPWGNDIDCGRANYICYDRVGKATPVGSYPANGYGLYDMAGNVWELVWDWFDPRYYSSSPGTDPRGPGRSVYIPGGGYSGRAYRGGSWDSYANSCRVANREQGWTGYISHDLGFRLVRKAP